MEPTIEQPPTIVVVVVIVIIAIVVVIVMQSMAIRLGNTADGRGKLTEQITGAR